MRYIRCIFKKHWDFDYNRFSHYAFIRDQGAISVINKDCVLARGVTICEHIRRFYCIQRPDERVFYWEFESDGFIPASAEIQPETGETGDPCHCNIHNLSHNHARKISKGIPIESVIFCGDGVARTATPNDFKDEFTPDDDLP
jgi:hypothetical protein